MNLIQDMVHKELQMCCETLCSKKVVQDYITYLEKTIEELKNGEESSDRNLGSSTEQQRYFDWYEESEDQFNEQKQAS